MSARSTRRKLIIAKPDEDELQKQMQDKKAQTALLIKTSGASSSNPIAMGGTAIERSMVSPGSLAVYSVKPVVSTEHKVGKKYTLFAVHIQNAISGRSWVVHRRYTDFVTLRELIGAHFRLFSEEFPRLQQLTEELYFPRKHKIRSGFGKVVEHRCQAFLEYLIALHRILISQNYLFRKEISDIGLSIFRGFIGSSVVQNSAHKDYVFHKPIRPSNLKPGDRSPVNQCGSLQTVLEEDAEYEVDEDGAEEPIEKYTVTDESTDEADFEGSSCGESTDTEDGDERDSIFRRHSQKYSRNRKSLTFLKRHTIS
ncbi:P-type atpase, partial [Globisporangium splendens]